MSKVATVKPHASHKYRIRKFTALIFWLATVLATLSLIITSCVTMHFNSANNLARIASHLYKDPFTRIEFIDTFSGRHRLVFADEDVTEYFYSSDGDIFRREYKYSVSVNLVGQEIIKLLYGDSNVYDKLIVCYDQEGNVLLRASGSFQYKIAGRNIVGEVIESGSKLNVALIWIFVLSTTFVIICLIANWHIESEKIAAANKAVAKLRQQEEAKLLAKAELRHKTTLLHWETEMSNLGYSEIDSIFLKGQHIWIDDQNFYQAESYSNYALKYNAIAYADEILNSDGIQAENIPPQELSVMTIKLDHVQCYFREGDLQYTTEIFGGSSSGSSLTGAIVGGIVAGEVGAIIGSRSPTNEITSHTTTHDSRQTIIRFYSGDAIETLSYEGFGLYEYLLRKIPEKDLLCLQLKANDTFIAQSYHTNIHEKLRKLKELHDEGLISDADYENKKDLLLQSL